MPQKKKTQKRSDITVGEFEKLVFNKFNLTKKQKEFLKIAFDENTKIVFLSGPAGTSKSFLSVYAALQLYNMSENYKDILYVRTTAESAERSLGFLPGPQPLNSRILTKNGWVRMGDIKIGDKVYAWDGTETSVIGVYPKGVKPVFEVTASNDRKMRCCEDHLFYTRTFENKKRGKEGSVKPLSQIMDTLCVYKNLHGKARKKMNHNLPKIAPIDYPEKNLPIPPYTLGALLGDGSIGEAISIHSIDFEILERINKEVLSLNCYIDLFKFTADECKGYTIKCSEFENNKVSKRFVSTNLETREKKIYKTRAECLKNFPGLSAGNLWRLLKTQKPWKNFKFESLDSGIKYTNKIKNEIHNLGLLGKIHKDKFVPQIYKLGSKQQRLDILRGLLDTDGHCKENNGSVSFYSVSEQLAKDVQDIVWSLGGNCSITKTDTTKKRGSFVNGRVVQGKLPCYVCFISLPVGINPFYLPRKAERLIQNYLHETKIKDVKYLKDEEVQCIEIDHPDHLYITDDYIVTHNTIQEKVNPFLMPLEEKLHELLKDKNQINYLFENFVIEPMPINFLRGASWRSKIVLAEESQNFSFKELTTLMTRIGENCKIFLCGDPMQSDINGKSGFADMLSLFEGYDSEKQGIHVFKFFEEDIMRSEILKFIVKKIENRPKNK